MKKLLLLLLLVGFSLGGCTMARNTMDWAGPPTMAESSGARHRRIGRAWNVQMRQVVEDFDYLMLIDRPTYLSPWQVRDGLPN